MTGRYASLPPHGKSSMRRTYRRYSTICLTGSPPAIDENRRSGYKRRRLRCEEHDRPRELFQLTPPPHRNVADELLVRGGVVQQLAVHVGRERARADRVACDPFTRPLERPHARQA